MQQLDLRLAPGEHGALADVALVGDLAGVHARRLVEQQRARDALRAPARLGRQRGQRGAQLLAQGLGRQRLRGSR
jgi:hypothetical protein